MREGGSRQGIGGPPSPSFFLLRIRFYQKLPKSDVSKPPLPPLKWGWCPSSVPSPNRKSWIRPCSRNQDRGPPTINLGSAIDGNIEPVTLNEPFTTDGKCRIHCIIPYCCELQSISFFGSKNCKCNIRKSKFI